MIGAFTLGRMLIRPYGHPIELIFPLFLAPFFVLHYGAFCWGHGSFLFSLFGPAAIAKQPLFESSLQMLATPAMLAAFSGLVISQLINWGRDIRARGLGADSVMDLMTKPYRRIVVLHITIIASGFALEAMNQSMVGLFLLVLLKIASDIWFWHRETLAATTDAQAFEFTDEVLKEMHEKYPRPVVEVNGKEREFDSFAGLKASSEFRLVQAVMRIIGASEDLKAVNTYMDMKVAEERRNTLA